MKLLDRYVLLSFLRNYLISMLVLIGLFVVLDMVFNLDELVELRGQPAPGAAGGDTSVFDVMIAIADYYFYKSFEIYVHLSGVIPVVAAAFTLIRMTRCNELSAVLAAGVPLLRVAAPIIIAAVVLNILLILDQELLIPNIIPKLTRDHDKLRSTEGKSFRIESIKDDRGALLTASRYTPPGEGGVALMREVDIFEYDADMLVDVHITADRAEWDPSAGVWRLTGGRRVEGLQPQNRRSREIEVQTYKSNLNPDEIALWRSGDYVTMLSTQRINELLQRRDSFGANQLLRVKHARFTQWILNVILLLLAIPFVLVREPTRLRHSILQCLMVIGLCMAGIFLAYQVAGNPPSGAQWADRWPAIWAWVPILLFGPLAIFLLDRLHTRGT